MSKIFFTVYSTGENEKKKKPWKFSISLYAPIIRHVLTDNPARFTNLHLSLSSKRGNEIPELGTSRPPQSCLTTTNPRQWRLCAFPTFLLGFTSLRISCFLQRGWPYELVIAALRHAREADREPWPRNARGRKENEGTTT